MFSSTAKQGDQMIGVEQIAERFSQGIDCGQIVLASAADKLCIDEADAYKMAAGFGGGMFRGQACGAVVGAIIAIGMKHGHSGAGAQEQKALNTSKVVEFQRRFLEKYPSTVCRDILGYDISKPEEMHIIAEKGLLFTLCPKVTAEAMAILNDLL
jgi:C_GCAxxG_C_C family probable redox protein